jgi:uncharacterized RDD family membrane protein YckC
MPGAGSKDEEEMADAPAIRAPEMGHYFAPQDHAGLFRRFLIITVDLAVAALAAIAIAAIGMAADEGGSLPALSVYAWIAFCYAYFVFLEASDIGTLGFRVTGVRIVTLKGERPSLLRMTFRLLIWVLGPINVLVDLFWLTGDENKQTLRDKFAGTLVVRKRAHPLGTGEIRLNRYQFLGNSFVFYEVTRPTTGS